MSTPAQLDILINIEAKLNELMKTQQGLRDTTKEANSLGAALKAGFGIETARRGMDLLKEGIIGAIREAVHLAEEINNTSRALRMSTDAFQVMRNVIKDTGGDVGALTAAVNQQMQSMDAGRVVTSSAAAAYRTLGLNLADLEKMPVEKRFEAIARANADADDTTAAYRATAEILGSRTLPQLQGALRELAEKGYGKLAEESKKAGQVMDESAVRDLAHLKDQLDQLARQRAVAAGEMVSFFHMLSQGVMNDPARVLNSVNPFSDQFGHLSDFLADFLPGPSGNPAPNSTTITPLEQSEPWLNSSLKLQQAQTNQSIIEGNSLRDVTVKRKQMVDAINDEIAARQKLMKLVQDDVTLDPNTRKRLSDTLQRQQSDAFNRLGENQSPRSDQEANYSNFYSFSRGMNAQGGALLGAGGGFEAGLQQWAMATGTYGQQIASTLQGTVGGAIDSLGQGLFGLITHTQSLGDAARNMGAMFVQSLIMMTIRALAFAAIMLILNMIPGFSAFAKGLDAATGGSGGGLKGVVAGGSYIPGKATGGSVMAGRPYIVGERGPELMIPGLNGSIVPNETFTRMSPGIGSSSAVGAMKPRVYILQPDTEERFQAMVRHPGWDRHVVGTVSRRRGDLGNT